MIANKDILLLGIDIGTTGTKCSFYDLRGKIVAHAYEEYPMIHPNEGWTEQNPAKWWSAVISNLNKCFYKQNINKERVSAISVSCTNALTIVDKSGNPLYNAIGHHDLRSDKQVKWLKENVGEELVFKTTANRLTNGTFCLPTLRWLIDNKPELMDKAYKFLMPSGFIIHKLTGEFSINKPRMSLTSLSDITRGEWSEEIALKAQIPTDILPKPYSSCEIVGKVSEEAARLTGLRKGTPVTAGCLDTAVATAGAGAVYDGDIALTLGSSGRLCFISDEPIFDKRLLNCRSPFDGHYTIIQSTDNAGISLRWFRDVFGNAIMPNLDLKGKTKYDYMNELAETTPPTSDGLIYLPYLAGEKSPIWNPKARGVFFNIGLKTEYGHFVRSVMEGVAMSLRDCMSIMPNVSNLNNSPIPLGGGVANSKVWCQIISDVLNRPILQLKSNETETLGDAIIAAQSIGLDEISKDFGKTMALSGTLIEPNKDNVALYDEHFEKYKKLYSCIKELY